MLKIAYQVPGKQKIADRSRVCARERPLRQEPCICITMIRTVYPLPCIFYLLTGLYCPGCGAGRACYSILHLRFADALCYNPLMTILLPLIGLYIVSTGPGLGDHGRESR